MCDSNVTFAYSDLLCPNLDHCFVTISDMLAIIDLGKGITAEHFLRHKLTTAENELLDPQGRC